MKSALKDVEVLNVENFVFFDVPGRLLLACCTNDSCKEGPLLRWLPLPHLWLLIGASPSRSIDTSRKIEFNIQYCISMLMYQGKEKVKKNLEKKVFRSNY